MRIGLQLPALGIGQISLNQLQGAPLQAAHHQALRQAATLARFPQQQLKGHTAQTHSQGRYQQQLHQAETSTNTNTT